MGIEFGAPLSLDDVPSMPGDQGNGEPYFYIHNGHVARARDMSRSGMRSSVSAGFVFRNEADANLFAEALKLLRDHLIRSAA